MEGCLKSRRLLPRTWRLRLPRLRTKHLRGRRRHCHLRREVSFLFHVEFHKTAFFWILRVVGWYLRYCMREFYTWFTCGRDLFLSFYPQPTGAKVGTSNGEDGADDREDWGADQKGGNLVSLDRLPLKPASPHIFNTPDMKREWKPQKNAGPGCNKRTNSLQKPLFLKGYMSCREESVLSLPMNLDFDGHKLSILYAEKNSWWGKLGFNWWENGRCVGLFGFIQCRFFSVLDGWFYEILLAT